MNGTLTDPLTLAVTPKKGNLTFCFRRCNNWQDACEGCWRVYLVLALAIFGSQFFSDPVNDIAVAGVLTCFISQRCYAAHHVPPLRWVTWKALLSHNGAPFPSRRRPSTKWAGDSTTKYALHNLINSTDSASGPSATLDKTAGIPRFTRTWTYSSETSFRPRPFPGPRRKFQEFPD